MAARTYRSGGGAVLPGSANLLVSILLLAAAGAEALRRTANPAEVLDRSPLRKDEFIPFVRR